MSRKSCLAGILPAAALLKPAKRSIRDFYAELAGDVMISGVAVGGDGCNACLDNTRERMGRC